MRHMGLIFMSIISLFMPVSVSFAQPVGSKECCCSWSSPRACAECPADHFAGCVTRGTSDCKCTCTRTRDEMTNFLRKVMPSSGLDQSFQYHGFERGDFSASQGEWNIKIIDKQAGSSSGPWQYDPTVPPPLDFPGLRN